MGFVLTALNVLLFNIIIPLLILNLVIFAHELGHYLAARAFKTAIKEFSAGMGPKIFSARKNKTDYSIRAVPIGGALVMHGEDGESEQKNAVSAKPVWQRFIIIAAGPAMNLLLGFIIMTVIVSGLGRYYSTEVLRFRAGAISESGGLRTGDAIVKINEKKINIYDDIFYALMREGKNPVDVTVVRDGEKLVVRGVKFPVSTEGGMSFGVVDFDTTVYERGFGVVVNQSFFRSVGTINLVWTSLFDVFTGKYGADAGITLITGDSSREAGEDRGKGRGFLFLIAVITINLGVVNLLPLPAIDGGKMVFLALEFVRRKPLKPEYEGYIHLAGFAALLLFIIFVTYKDIMKLVAG